MIHEKGRCAVLFSNAKAYMKQKGKPCGIRFPSHISAACRNGFSFLILTKSAPMLISIIACQHKSMVKLLTV